VDRPGRNKERRFMCLREEFRAAFPWNLVELKRDGFRRWARSERIPPINVPAQHWRPMRDGEPVPAATLEAFSEYIGEVKSITGVRDCTLSRIAMHYEPPHLAEKGKDRQKDAWGLGWKALYVHISDAFKLDDESYCADVDDLVLAASVIYECEGWRHKRLAGRQAIAYTQDLVGCSLDGYARSTPTTRLTIPSCR
jgi:hypothetical protein